MRIAHLILTHGDPAQLERLINKISYADDCIYIHVDLKTDIHTYRHLFNKPQIHFIQNRVKVYWGTFSIVQATINALTEILESSGSFDFLNLLSSQDYPLKSNKEIHDFLEANKEKAFMEFYDVYSVWKEAIPRIEKYFLTEYHFKGKHLVEGLLNKILPKRKLPYHLTAVGRSQWFTIPYTHAAFIVQYIKEHNKLIPFFKLTWGSDELFFQTILFNSPFRNKMINNNVRYIDWSDKKASPKTLTLADATKLLESGKLYARKFNIIIDSNVLDYIDEQIQSGSSLL